MGRGSTDISISQGEGIKLIQYQIMYRFGDSETITTNQGTVGIKFIEDKVVAFAQQFAIKLIHSSPYYAQANGKAVATNKIIIG